MNALTVRFVECRGLFAEQAESQAGLDFAHCLSAKKKSPLRGPNIGLR